MRRLPDPRFHTGWLLTLCAALGIAFLFALSTIGCEVPEDGTLPEVDVSGRELPEHDTDVEDEIERGRER